MSLLLTAAVALTAVAAQEQEHPVLARVKASVKDPSKPFVMIITFKVKEGAGPKFEAAFAKAIKETRKEKGNKAYELSRSTKDPNEYILYENWENVAALGAHLKTEQIKQLGAERQGTTEGNPDVKVLVPVGD
jgi:quinol monooxygenase YgiN